MTTFIEFLDMALPLLINRNVLKVEHDVVEGHVMAYWAGTVIRFDLKPKEEK